MRILRLTFGLAQLALFAGATTLQRLDLDEMVQRATSIVQAKVLDSHGVLRGGDVYTVYRLQVTDQWKSAPSKTIEVAVPGGVAGPLRQIVAGAPTLDVNREYVLFLWTSRTGLTQVLGLTQGLFRVIQDSEGATMAVRSAATELMLDKGGRPVADQAVSMPLLRLRAEVRRVSGQKGPER